MASAKAKGKASCTSSQTTSKGFDLASSQPATVPRVAAIGPEEFFQNFVALRRPCILSAEAVTTIAGEKWNISRWASLAYLRQHAGKSTVQIEHRQDATKTYGTGAMPRTLGRLEDFIQEIQKGNSNVYLTTQYQENVDDSGDTQEDLAKATVPSPLECLLDDFPLRPKILGQLELAQANLWFGHSAAGASSGLHHDFHDNLYCLIAGRKRFTLFPPSEHARMYTHGRVTTAHENGLLVYDGLDVRADGACGVELARYLAEKAEKALKDLEAEKRKVAQKEMDAAKRLLASAKAQLASFEGKSAEEDSSVEDGPPAFGDDAGSDGDFDFPKGDDFDELEADLDGDEPESRQKRKRVDDDASEDAEESKRKRTKAEEAQASHPPSFCQVPVELIHPPQTPTKELKQLEKQFSKFDRKKGISCELSAGDFLFLPASWFHEVTSFSSASEGPEEKFHLALNFWCHPPTDLSNFDSPYEDEFWKNRWTTMVAPRLLEAFNWSPPN